MSTLSKTLSLARQLQDLVGPSQPSSQPSNRQIPPLLLPSPPDLSSSLRRLGVAPALASSLSSLCLKQGLEVGNRILLAYQEVSTILQRSEANIAKHLPRAEVDTYFAHQDSKLIAAFLSKYQVFLHMMETRVFDKVALRRQRFAEEKRQQQLQYRHSTRKGFAKKSVEVLRKIYLVESYPNIAELRVIAQHIGMDYKQTRVWFQNRRNRKKRSKRGIFEDNRIAKTAGLPTPNPARITKRTARQDQENAIIRTSVSPKLTKKSLALGKKGGKSSARKRQEAEQMARDREMQQQMGLVSMGPSEDDDDVEMGGGEGGRRGMDGFQGFSFNYHVQPPSSLSPNPYHYAQHSQHLQPHASGRSSSAHPAYAPHNHSSGYASHHQAHLAPSHPHSSRFYGQDGLVHAPPPFHHDSPPSDPLKSLWDIASTEPPSSYETFDRAPAVPSNLSFVTPLPSDQLHHSVSVEPSWYTVLPAIGSPADEQHPSSSSHHSHSSSSPTDPQAWDELRPADVAVAGELPLPFDISQLFAPVEGGEGGAGANVPGAVGGYLPLANGAVDANTNTYMDSIWNSFEAEHQGMSFVIPETANHTTW